MSSKYLGFAQIRAIEKIGDVMIPGSEGFPSFSEAGCVRHLDRILDYMPAQDLKDLGMLLSSLSLLPGFLVRFFIWFLEHGSTWPGPIGALTRTIRLGVRGLVMSLYYGDPAVLKEVGYEVGVFTESN